MKFRASLVAIGIVAAFAAVGQSPATAYETSNQGTLPSAKPVSWTPTVLGDGRGGRGKILSIAQVGNLIIIGGLFNQVQDKRRGLTLDRTNIAAFDATTGAVSDTFNPVLNDVVDKVKAAPDGTSVYVGGDFTTLNGAGATHLLDLNVATGAAVPGFTAQVKGTVQGLDIVGNRLFIGGQFQTVNGKPAFRLAEVNTVTGKTSNTLDVTIAGTQHGTGTTSVMTLDASADGQHLLISGNFSTVNGVLHSQVAEFTVTPTGLSLDPWHSTLFDANSCSSHYDQWVLDAQFSPDSSYFVVDGTGAYGNGTAGLCDSASRWNVDPNNATASPVWVQRAGGDSFTSVEVTDTAVYVGGHYRWLNNPSCGDRACGGAIDYTGLGALDPVNGLPLNWNPGGVVKLGYYDFLPTDQGLYVGGDYEVTGDCSCAGLAYFPLAGGHTPPASTVATLPVNLYGLGKTSGTTTDQNSATVRSYDGTTFGAANTMGNTTGWSTARGAFDINNNAYVALSNGTLTKQTFDGATFGSATTVNLHNLTAFASEMTQMTGAFYLNGTLYFTVSNSAQLRSRGFDADQDVVDGLEKVVTGNITGVDWTRVGSMFYANGNLYWVDKLTGRLMRTAFTNGAPVAGTTVQVSGPGVDSQVWNSRALFTTLPVNQPPVANLQANCTGMTCALDGSLSTDPDGTISSYAWNFGDSGTATTATANHTYTAPGTYSISLTVTDNRGGTNTATQTVTVAPLASPISFVDSSDSGVSTAYVKSFSTTVPATVQAGDTLLLFGSINANSASSTLSAPAGWTLVQAASSTTDDIQGAIWTRAATASDAGSTVSIGSTKAAKGTEQLLAYRGVSATNPVQSAALVPETTAAKTHNSPTLTNSSGTSWLLSFWSEKSSATTGGLTPPASGTTQRDYSLGTAGAHITSLVVDSAASVPVGSVGGLTATGPAKVTADLMGSLLLNPGP